MECFCTAKETIEKVQMDLQDRNNVTDAGNKLMVKDSGRRGGRGVLGRIKWEMEID